MTPTPAPPSWDSALRAELVAAAARQQRRRQQRRRLPLAGALLVAGLAVGLLATQPREAAAEVRIERTGDRVVITLLELQADPEAVEAELRAAGFDAAIEPVPTGPSAVGRFVGTTELGPLDTEVVPLDLSGTTFSTFALPAGWDGALRLHVGRPARPGEAYLGFTDALAPGEPLACLPVVGRRAHPALAELAPRAALLEVRRWDAPDAAPLTADELEGAFSAWVVLRADAISPGRVIVWLVPPTTDPMPTPGGPVACAP